MHIHILGICGTFMGSLAVIAKQLGHQVSGSDANVYPPMSTQLEAQGIELMQGYHAENLRPAPDLVIIGNALTRGNAAVEHVLSSGITYCSGPEWLARWVLKDRWVLGVAGTHGKTTTSAMLAWILEYAGLKPGYLIGGVTNNFTSSAALGQSPFFVVEADEYDTAFFDKRSKFIHYAPRTAILNNLEFDHGDIFDDLQAIQTQFHHLVRTIPGNGLIISPLGNANLDSVLARGCWTPRQLTTVSMPNQECQALAANGAVLWNAKLRDSAGSQFDVMKYGAGPKAQLLNQAHISWGLTGAHNVYNALSAVAAAHHAGVSVAVACAALNDFKGVKRRMELRAEVDGVWVYDDFAHHPTAIATTLAGAAAQLAQLNEESRLIAVIEPRSNTMKMGIHQQALANATSVADFTLWLQPATAKIDLRRIVEDSQRPGEVLTSTDDIISYLVKFCVRGDRIVIMSNGGFDGIHQKLISALQQRHEHRQ